MPKPISDAQQHVLNVLERFGTTIIEVQSRYGPRAYFKMRVPKPDRKIRAKTVHSLARSGHLQQNEAGEWELVR